ncbi:MAG: glycerol-3-phosphate responsive antiterminator [Fusobacterium sp.]|uniref:glycerol-3-phosphate responsive antiterminator n=1 Tax=Fusobacterium sp. TaxID=68766 RepID=UPI0026DCB512|nr:glycerol-3-phosphate responsive antiterminator [Fusobacterium sp.]MDO4690823.1 glycerol-3-phosphate responsive antiterminator [Fusobacterium sp.]
MKIREILERNPVIPAIKDDKTFEAALNSHNEIVFIIMSNIIDIKNICVRLKEQNKIVFIHVDMIDGLNSTSFGVDYIVNNIKPDGILTTKSNVVAHAHKNNIKVIQRFFILDSLSYKKALQNIKENKVIAVEIMPGLMPKILKKISSQIYQPVITGGLISEKEDIINAINAGALSVSTTNIKLWDI